MLHHHSNTGKRLIASVFLGAIAAILSLISSGIDAAAAPPAGPSHWPAYGKVPPTTSPEVKAWLKLVDWTKVPKIGVRHTKDPGPPACPEVAAPASDCWWTCSGCAAPDDVVDCPGKKVWGLTFDDGPEPGTTEKLLDLMHEKNVTATFFVTGMKSTKAPALLKQTIDRGHHLASHTELMWTEKFVFDHTGYKLKYFRPPYGRRTPSSPAPRCRIISKLKRVVLRKKGVITLEHDGAPQMVAMARTLLDLGMKSGLKPMDIASCLSDKVGYNAVPAKPATNEPGEHIADGTGGTGGSGAPATNAGGSKGPGEAVGATDGPLPKGSAQAKASALRESSGLLWAMGATLASVALGASVN